MDIFDVADSGTFSEFKKTFKGDINQTDKYLDLNLLCAVILGEGDDAEQLAKAQFLIDKEININYVTGKEKRNALHLYYFSNWRPDHQFALEVTKLLLESGINVNAKDDYNAIPLKCLLTLNKQPTMENKDLYMLLLNAGSDYRHKDEFGKSCLDYAEEFSWRNDFVGIVEEYENGWNLYSIEDDEDYISTDTIEKVAPVLLEFFNAPYGTDLCWQYEDGVLVGFYDLVRDKETNIEEILANK